MLQKVSNYHTDYKQVLINIDQQIPSYFFLQARKKNEEMKRAADEKKKDAEQKRREADDARMREQQEHIDKERVQREQVCKVYGW